MKSNDKCKFACLVLKKNGLYLHFLHPLQGLNSHFVTLIKLYCCYRICIMWVNSYVFYQSFRLFKMIGKSFSTVRGK